jgi:hypothetical protein
MDQREKFYKQTPKKAKRRHPSDEENEQESQGTDSDRGQGIRVRLFEPAERDWHNASKQGTTQPSRKRAKANDSQGSQRPCIFRCFCGLPAAYEEVIRGEKAGQGFYTCPLAKSRDPLLEMEKCALWTWSELLPKEHDRLLRKVKDVRHN